MEVEKTMYSYLINFATNCCEADKLRNYLLEPNAVLELEIMEGFPNEIGLDSGELFFRLDRSRILIFDESV